MYDKERELPVYIERGKIGNLTQIGWYKVDDFTLAYMVVILCFRPKIGQCLVIRKKNFKKNLKKIRDSERFTSLLREY